MFPQPLKLALRLVWRDARSGELALLLAAVIIAVAGVSSVSLLGHRLTRTLQAQAAEFMAADMAISSHEPVPETWPREARELGLAHSSTAEFATVLVEGDQLLLCGIKAAAAGYPLRGQLLVADQPDQAAGVPVAAGPPSGEIWVDRRVLQSLGVSLGGTLTVGELPLKVSHLLLQEPDRRGDLFSLAPRVLMNQADLPATKTVQPGSHVHYYALFAGPEDALRALKAKLKPELHPGQRLVDLHEDRPELGNALSRAERYLNLSSLLIVVIAGTAIAIGARRYTARHYDLTALLKCLGCSQGQVLLIHFLEYLVIGLLGSTIGLALGFAAHYAIATLLQPLLPRELAPPHWTAGFFGLALGSLLLLGFALSALFSVKHLPPLRVLRRDLPGTPINARLTYGASALSIAGLTLWLTRDPHLTAWVLGLGAAVMAAGAIASYGLLSLLARLVPRHGLGWRLGARNLTGQPARSVGQILSFGLTLAAMLLGYLVHGELLEDWKRQLPAGAPNYFAMNLQESDRTSFRDFLDRHRIAASHFYPIARGRLTEINGIAAHSVAEKESQGEAAVNRDLNLTYSAELPPENRVTEGEWWPSPENGAAVSVEEKLAQSLHIKLGDRLRFNIGGHPLEATVASLRKLRWATLTPNFYVIFRPGDLDGLPQSYLGSIHVRADQKTALAELIRSFPAVTLLEVDALVRQLQGIVGEVSLAIETVLAFALAAGFAVLFASVRATLDQRLREQALLRSLGAPSSLLKLGLAAEFLGLGLLAGTLAVMSTEAVLWVLFERVFELEPTLHGRLWLVAPGGGALLVGLAGYLHSRRLLRVNPMAALREV